MITRICLLSHGTGRFASDGKWATCLVCEGTGAFQPAFKAQEAVESFQGSFLYRIVKKSVF